MDRIIERDSSSSVAMMIFGLLAIVIVAGVILYVLRVYPYVNSNQQDGIPVDVNVQGQLPGPSSSGY